MSALAKLILGRKIEGGVKKIANWTSTEVPMWETDCLQFWRTGMSFELRNVTLPEHEAFVREFAAMHGLRVRWREGCAIFDFDGDLPTEGPGGNMKM